MDMNLLQIMVFVMMLTNAYKVVTIATKTQIASITTVVFDVFANAVIEVMEEFVMTKMNVKKTLQNVFSMHIAETPMAVLNVTVKIIGMEMA